MASPSLGGASCVCVCLSPPRRLPLRPSSCLSVCLLLSCAPLVVSGLWSWGLLRGRVSGCRSGGGGGWVCMRSPVWLPGATINACCILILVYSSCEAVRLGMFMLYIFNSCAFFSETVQFVCYCWTNNIHRHGGARRTPISRLRRPFSCWSRCVVASNKPSAQPYTHFC